MRTRKSTVTFRCPFILNNEAGKLPAGSYDIEIDEEEIIATEWTGYRRTAVYFYVNGPGTTRMLVIDPAQLDAVLEQDAQRNTDTYSPSCPEE